MNRPLLFRLALCVCWLCPLWCHADRNLNRPGFTLTFHDEFDGPTLNPVKWNVTTGANNANNEWEIYSAPNVYLASGMLVLESDRLWDTNGNAYYTSGKVTSAGKFDQKYGRFEWTGQIPAGQGLWPAYWMLSYMGWPPEIDVMETIGTSVYCNTMSLHWGPLPPGCQYPWNCGRTENTVWCGPNFSSGFHTFAVDWEPWGAAWYVDGVQREWAGYLGNCTNNMYLIMNTAIGGDWPGAPDWSTPFPSYNLIDSVRVWKAVAGRYALLNPGFESGEAIYDFNDWNVYGDTNVVRDPVHGSPRTGNRALQITGHNNGQDNTSGIYQDLWAYPGELWQASVWGRSRPFDQVQGANEARLKLEFVDSGGNLLARSMQTVITNGSATNYSQFLVQAVAPVNTSRARAVMEYYQNGSTAGSVDFDDAGLTLLSPPLLSNPGLEAGSLSGWTTYGAGWDTVLAWSPDPVHNGAYSFKVWGGDFNPGNPNYAGVYQDIFSGPSAGYLADGLVYTKSSDQIAGPNKAWLELSFRDASRTNVLALYRSALIDSNSPADTWLYLPITNQYDPVALTITNTTLSPIAPPGTAIARYQMVFFQASGAGGSVFCDDFSLTQLSGPHSPAITNVTTFSPAVFVDPASNLTFTVSSPSTTIPTNGVQLILNGIDVSALLVLSGSPTNWTVRFPGLLQNQFYSGTINLLDANGFYATAVVPGFDTFSQSNFVWEAEDFDFGGGQFIDNPVPTSYAATNSYYMKSVPALTGIDLTTPNNDSGEQFAYRSDSCGTEAASDVVRQAYLKAQQTDPNAKDYDVGWWNGGTWLNYTRTFLTNNYHLYARLAGGNGAYAVTNCLVLSGRGTANQPTRILGTFTGSGSDWQSWQWVPLLDAAGQPALVSLGGVQTLKMISGGNVNANFYMLVPVPRSVTVLPSLTAGAPVLSFATQAGFNYSVLYKNDLREAYWKLLNTSAGDGNTRAFTNAPTGTARFYKLAIQ